MNYLLDTQILIWAAISPDNLSDRVRKELIDPANCLFLSYVSVWEMQIKGSDRLGLSTTLQAFIADQMKALKLIELQITQDHIFGLQGIAFYKVSHEHRTSI